MAYGLGIEPTVQHELEATLEARRELGRGHDDELVAGFLERIDRELDRRVDERLAQREPPRPRRSAINPANLAICVPIIAVSGAVGGGFAGVALAVVALVIVFLYADSRR